MVHLIRYALLLLLSVIFATGNRTQALSPDTSGQAPLHQRVADASLNFALPPADGPVVVHTSFHLLSINNVNDEARTFEFNGVLSLRWKDERQAFDPISYGAREKVFQTEYQAYELAGSWHPQVILANASVAYERSAVVRRVEPDGTCYLLENINASAKSFMDLHRYPFDQQRLEAVFELLGFDTSKVVLRLEPALDPVQDPEEIHLSQWDIHELRYACRTEQVPNARGTGSVSMLTIQLDMERRALSVMRLVVFPLFIIVILSWSVFWMDRSSLGDRMSVSFVGILTAVSYQILINDMLPHIGYVTLIHGYITLSFLVMCITVLINLWVGSLDRSGRTMTGDRIDHICRWAFPAAYGLSTAVLVILAFALF